jgi:cellulose synthase/poly-beta-1,6-N-acetylglucosamine synthase-like glycosyltransferase
MVLLISKIYVVFTVFILLLYMARHFFFTMNRLFFEQRIYYQDIIDSDLKKITVLVPMHNEERVAGQIMDLLVSDTDSYDNASKDPNTILDLLVSADYPHDKLEIIPINDFSTDQTRNILDEYAKHYPFVKPIHRYQGKPGKPAALNEGIRLASGEIIIVFDADYLPPKGILKDIAVCFNDPEVGAVMGRVVPVNTRTNLLTRVLDLERSGGYQVDQQARYNMKLIPQYGGTVGGFRRDLIRKLGSFNTKILAEDTELTFRLLINGWKVIYANRAECYEEAPEKWDVRGRQISRWSRGHNQVMLKYWLPVLKCKHLSIGEKIDGIFLLFVYAVPIILLLALFDLLALFFFGEMNIVSGITALIFVVAYNTFGNFAPFFQIGTASLLDNATNRIRLLPILIFNFFFNMWFIGIGFFGALAVTLTGRHSKWVKTVRFRKKEDKMSHVLLNLHRSKKPSDN